MKKQKPSGTLKKFLDVRDKGTKVVGSVERHLLSKPTNSEGRRTDVIHPSEMAKPDWCHRAQYFMLQGFPPPPSKYKTSLKQLLVFSEGHRIHGRWQDWLSEMGVLYGRRTCNSCDLNAWSLDHICPNDGSKTQYMEVSLNYEPLRIGGHADGWIKGLGNDMLLEIKSVGEGSFRWENPDIFYEHNGNMAAMWKAFNAPFYTHIMQTQIYLKLIELLGMEDAPQEVVFIYENKATQEVKEFTIPKSDFAVAELFASAENIVAAVDKGVPPTCNIDPVAGCYKCNHYTEASND